RPGARRREASGDLSWRGSNANRTAHAAPAPSRRSGARSSTPTTKSPENEDGRVDQTAYQTITAKPTAPGPSQGDDKALLLIYERALIGVETAAIVTAAERFMTGKVKGQNMRFAPSTAEFRVKVRRRLMNEKPTGWGCAAGFERNYVRVRWP